MQMSFYRAAKHTSSATLGCLSLRFGYVFAGNVVAWQLSGLHRGLAGLDTLLR